MIGKLFRLLRVILVSIIFILGSFSVVFSECVGILVSLIFYHRMESDLSHAWIARTKTSFIVLLTTVLNIVSKTPITLRITSPNLGSDRLLKYTDGSIETKLAPHAVFFGNHQIYTDWVFIWWLTYTAEMSGFIYILLKHELSKIPVLGLGMKLYGFIFLTRKWAVDKLNMAAGLQKIDANARGKGPTSGAVLDSEGKWPSGNDPSQSWPYQMLIYPEGTNISANTRNKTEIYAAKVGKKPFKHILLPKTTGFRYTLLNLKDTIKEVYDLTIGYAGVKENEYGQDIYTLNQVFFHGKNPPQVDFYIRVLNINEIPLGKLEYDDPEEEAKDQKIFEDWLYKVWEEKDELMDKFYKTGSFVDEKDKPYTQVSTEVQTRFQDFLSIFAVPGILIAVLRILWLIYDAKYNPGSCSAPPPNISSATPFDDL